MADEKIHYSDLITPDDSIQKLVAELTELNKLYGQTLEAVRSGTERITAALSKASGATKQGRKQIEDATDIATKLDKAYEALDEALSETGRELAIVKNEIREVNAETVRHNKQIIAQAGSYDRMKADLKELTALYKSLGTKDLMDPAMGGAALKEIQELTKKIQAFEKSLRPATEQVKKHTNVQRTQKVVLTTLEKAKKAYTDATKAENKELQKVRLQTEEANKAAKAYAATQVYAAESIEGTKAKMQALQLEYNRLNMADATDKARAEKIVEEYTTLTLSLEQYKLKADEVLVLQEKRKQAHSDQAKAISLERHELERANLEANTQNIIAREGEGSYNALQAELKELIFRYKELNQYTEADQKSAADLAERIRVLRVQIGLMEEEMGSSNLGQYGSQFDRLGYSVQQVVREVPSAAIGFETFILAISNNIPVVIDEINRLREANRAMALANKDKVIPIGKQVLKSLLSWQTALMALITVFSVHGAAILDWVKKIFTGNKALISFEKALNNTRKALIEDASSLGDNLALYAKLQLQWNALKTEGQKTQWLEDMTDQFHQLGVELDNINEANQFFIDSQDEIKRAYLNQAIAAAAMELASKEAEKAVRAQIELDKEQERQAEGKTTFWQKLRASFAEAAQFSSPSARIIRSVTAEDMRAGDIARYDALVDEAEQGVEQYAAVAAKYEELAQKILSAFAIEDKQSKGRTKTGRDLEDRINSLYLKAKKNYEESVTAIEQDELEKRRKQAEDDYNQRIRDLQNDIAKAEAMLANTDGKYKELTEEQKAKLQETIKVLKASLPAAYREYMRELFDIDDEAAAQLRERLISDNELRLELAQEGSQEELDLRLRAIDLELAAELEANSKRTGYLRQEEELIKQVYEKRKQLTQATYDFQKFEKGQSIAAAEFELTQPSSRRRDIFTKGQEKAKLEYQITNAAALGLTPEDIKLAQVQIQGINKELDELNSISSQIAEYGVGGTVLYSLGFDDKAISAFNSAVSTVISSLQEIAQAEVDAAQAAVDAAAERVSAAQSAYEAEIEARNNGYANNVATAQKELQQEKKKQQEKEKLLAEAQKRQEQLNTLTQASSLITASANLWSSFSGVPVVGPALALAAIAAMWGSFAVAKVKAKQVASQEYGEGGLEFLEGGSHASGNDIDLGTRNSRGRSMKAEGGEAMAIINKRSTRRYRKQLPGIVEALNKGTFEDKYLRAFESGEVLHAQINTNSTVIDLSRIERDVQEIKKQNSSKYYALADGTMLIVKGNVKRFVRQ